MTESEFADWLIAVSAPFPIDDETIEGILVNNMYCSKEEYIAAKNRAMNQHDPYRNIVTKV